MMKAVTSAATHLGIRLRDYDSRIRTFIPDYDDMLDAAAHALATTVTRAPVILDLGTGTGALARRCAELVPYARLIGIDADEGMLAMARARLGDRLVTRAGDFMATPFPRANAVTASFALHHIRTPRQKATLYRKAFASLSRRGMLVSADCFLAGDAALRADDHEAWLTHLERAYSRRRAKVLLSTWAKEDTYLPLSQEVDLLSAAGFRVDIAWRCQGFAVVVGRRS